LAPRPSPGGIQAHPARAPGVDPAGGRCRSRAAWAPGDPEVVHARPPAQLIPGRVDADPCANRDGVDDDVYAGRLAAAGGHRAPVGRRRTGRRRCGRRHAPAHSGPVQI
jgi:hypothetical protein